MRKKSFVKSLLILVVLTALLVPAFACSEGPADGQQGKYLCEYEKGPLFSLDYPDYYYTLDGHGKGEYYHKNSTHKVKYTYSSDGTINLQDTITGIKYNGTLKNGELHIYDGNKDSATVSEFLFIKE
ncbi:MAG: hypothetical protein IKO32_09420 [Lachnospiraceae bacterium]|nr:hypothetical protein [Lachnospiraceae bacterium]